MDFVITPFNASSPLLVEGARVYQTVWGRDLADSIAFFRDYAIWPDHIGYVAQTQDVTVGVGWGTRSQEGQWWHDRVASQIGRDHPALQDAWVLTELAVLRAYRGHGIGSALHDALLAAQPATHTLLSTQVENSAAQAFYLQRGWWVLHPGFVFHAGNVPYLVMARRAR